MSYVALKRKRIVSSVIDYNEPLSFIFIYIYIYLVCLLSSSYNEKGECVERNYYRYYPSHDTCRKECLFFFSFPFHSLMDDRKQLLLVVWHSINLLLEWCCNHIHILIGVTYIFNTQRWKDETISLRDLREKRVSTGTISCVYIYTNTCENRK
jgi:hypothetical protein